MKTIFLNELKRTRKSLFIWCLVIAILVIFGILEYPFVSDYIHELMPVFDAMPKIVSIMFGIYQVDFMTTIGYYICMYFWCTLVTYVHATYIGASIITKDERDNTIDYLYTKPYQRKVILQAKTLVGLLNIFIVAVVAGGLSIISLMMISLDMSDLKLVLLTLLGMFFTQIIFMMMGMLCSLFMKTYKKGILVAMISLGLFYGLSVTIQYFEVSDSLHIFSPLQYFDAKLVIANGLNLSYLVISVMIVVACFAFSVRMIEKRELHS